jgi:CelD/BcsL family acetyltransferase involved in cellulose biosynthesis
LTGGELAPTVFQSPPYLENYRRFFGAGKSFHALEAESARAWLMTRGRAWKRLEWWGAGIHDIGAASSTRSQDWVALWREIEGSAARCDMTQLAQIEATSPLVELARGANWQVSPAEKCPLLVLPQTWEEYVPSLGKNMREQIKRLPRKLERNFAVSYHLAQTESELQEALDDLFRLHGKRWRARGQTGVLVLPRRQKFQRALCRDLLALGWLRLWTLRCDGRAVGSLLFYFYNGRYSYFIGGFDPELSQWNIGTCLFAHVIKYAIGEGAHDLDFLKGEETYKYRLGATNRDYVTLETFRAGWRGRVMQRRADLEKVLMQRFYERFGAAHANPTPPQSSTRKQQNHEQGQ